MPGADLLKLVAGVEPGVVIFSGDFTIRFVSRTTLVLFGGLPASQLFAGGVLDFHGEQTRRRIVEALRVALESQRQVPLSFKLVTRDGLDRFLLVKLTPLLDAEMRSDTICALFYDITSLISEERKLKRIPVSVRDEIKLLKPEEIAYVRAANIYSDVCTASGEHHCDLPLGALEKRLPAEQFFRIHRSYLVNVAFVRKVHRDHSGCAVEFGHTEARLPISRHKIHEFLSVVGLK